MKKFINYIIKTLKINFLTKIPVDDAPNKHEKSVKIDIISETMPYDASLLERSITQWQFGEWSRLLILTHENIKTNPDRAKLALLAATARLQLDKFDEAQDLIKHSIDWGINKKILIRFLLSGTCNTLGRISLLRDEKDTAIENFKKSISIAIPNSELDLLTDARVNKQLYQLHDAGVIAAAEINFAIKSNQQTDSIQAHQKQNEFTGRSSTDITPNQILLKDEITTTLKKEIQIAVGQIEAHLSLQNYLNTGELPDFDIENNKWPASPDFGLLIVKTIETNDYDLVIEFGSGITTDIIAKSVKNRKTKHGKKINVLSYEHLEVYFNKTKELLKTSGNEDYIDLTLAPIVDWDGNNAYYDEKLIKSKLIPSAKKILVIIDGPPASTCKHARYPALPILFDFYPNSAIDFLLDDYIRAEEKEIVLMWEQFLDSKKIKFNLQKYDLQRGACILSIGKLKQ